MKKIITLSAFMLSITIGTNAQNTSPYWSIAGNNNETGKSKLGTTNKISLHFYTNNVQRMYIDSSSGRVGIGIANPAYKLDVNGTAGIRNTLTVTRGGIVSHSTGTAVYGNCSSTDSGYGVYGTGRIGVYANTTETYGLLAYATGSTGIGIYTYSQNNSGILAVTGASSNDYAGFFIGNVYSSGSYLGSDIKLKKNITGVDNAMDIINKLQPKNYEYRNDGSYAKMNLPAGKHYGFIAQDIETILPNLVKQSQYNTARSNPDETTPSLVSQAGTGATAVPSNTSAKGEIIDFKAVNYTELIPIMVKAMQEQQNQINKVIADNDAKDSQIADLQRQVNDLKNLVSKGGNNTISITSGSYLQQNVPNPSGNNTVINYFVSGEIKSAQIIITDEKGSLIKTYNASSGQGQLNIKSGELAAGVYAYTLYANNIKVDTKQLVITK